MIRETNRKLTGQVTQHFELVLGQREDGSPGITLHAAHYGRSHACFDDPAVVRELICELQEGLAHLEGRY